MCISWRITWSSRLPVILFFLGKVHKRIKVSSIRKSFGLVQHRVPYSFALSHGKISNHGQPEKELNGPCFPSSLIGGNSMQPWLPLVGGLQDGHHFHLILVKFACRWYLLLVTYQSNAWLEEISDGGKYWPRWTMSAIGHAFLLGNHLFWCYFLR